jgi:uncharacterized protein (DUF2141 family)
MLRIALPAALALFAVTSLQAAEINVTVHGISHAGGTLSALLVDSAEAWDGKGKPVDGRRVEVTSSDVLQVMFADVAPGHYALRLMHDENGNGKLDSNFVGMPTEGYGFSNNPRVMRPATFDEAKFEVGADGAAVTIELR